MALKDQLQTIADTIKTSRDTMSQEQATKQGLIMPFIMALGYNVFNPNEVKAEDPCTCGDKSEKIDYAIYGGDMQEPRLLIECKAINEKLDKHVPQLERYFKFSKSKFGLLTNGQEYRFYTGEDDMDKIPFLMFDITTITDKELEQLEKLTKDKFNADEVANTARKLKYMEQFRIAIDKEFKEPSDELVKYFVKNTDYGKSVTTKALEEFKPLLKSSLSNYIEERIDVRLSNAKKAEEQPTEIVDASAMDDTLNAKSKIETTEDEINAYNIIKAICVSKVPVDKIVLNDNENYCAINYINTRQPLCRLYFNNPDKKQIGLFDKGKWYQNRSKMDDKYEIATLDDIYKYNNELLATIDLYDSGKYSKPNDTAVDTATSENESIM
jgi:hypothetical protein